MDTYNNELINNERVFKEILTEIKEHKNYTKIICYIVIFIFVLQLIFMLINTIRTIFKI